MKKIAYLITDENIIVNFEGSTFTINASSDKIKYDTLLKHLKAKDENSIIEMLRPIKKIVKYANEYFYVNSEGNVFLNDVPDEELPIFIGEKLIDFINSGLDILPVVNFWKNLRQNPSTEAKLDLYHFLTVNKHPLTEDGMFIAYKKVNSVKDSTKLVDNYTKTLDNSVGKLVKIDRKLVNSDRNVSCAAGLHVASMSYATTYSGNVLIEVKVNPKDVVAVPRDYNSGKMRVCAYEVLGLVKDTSKKVTSDAAKKLELLRKLPKEKTDIIKKVEATLIQPVSEIKKEIEKELTVDISKLSANQIKELVIKKTGSYISLNSKNKTGIVKKAISLLEEKGFTVKS